MPLIEKSEQIEGVILVTPDIYGDDRGFFIETYRREWLPLGREMIQGNRGDRKASSIVGFHYHLHQADYWYVPYGSCRVILHDLRVGSKTQRNTLSLDVGAQEDGTHKHTGIFIPPGVAHGFAAITDMTITYMVDNYYNSADELGVAWDDPSINAKWGIENPVLSERDKKNPLFEQIRDEFIPHAQLRT
jgi:dTDP-4-dehydrorhamnose 3,5-epimerase